MRRVPDGIFSSHCTSNKQYTPIAEISTVELRHYLQQLWKNEPKMLIVDQAAELTGYGKGTIRE